MLHIIIYIEKLKKPHRHQAIGTRSKMHISDILGTTGGHTETAGGQSTSFIHSHRERQYPLGMMSCQSIMILYMHKDWEGWSETSIGIRCG